MILAERSYCRLVLLMFRCTYTSWADAKKVACYLYINGEESVQHKCWKPKVALGGTRVRADMIG